MLPKLKWAGLKKTKAWEYALRFAFGGLVTMAAGVLADAYGPDIGGLMLAFPAILPASLTLVEYHDGREKAVDDARGARIGSLALALFGGVVWLGGQAWAPPLMLAAATLVWIAASVALWALKYG
jgi:hypothetical protein